MSYLEEGIPDLHLSIDCGDNSVRPQTGHIPPENVDPMQITEYVTSDTLYLSRRKLKDIEDSILKTHMLKNLYLEGNQISSLPDSLFTSLSNLVWLDLRNNQITALPAEIGLHRSLKTLLLEGNPIKELPLELGTVITLRALSLRHCPIVFPPQEIVEQGLQCILQFLRGAMVVRPVSVRNPLPDMPPVEKLQLAELVKSSLDLCEEVVNEDEMRRFKELKQKMIQMDRAESDYGAAALPLACLPGAAAPPLACLPRAAAPPLACLPRAAAPPLACLPGAAAPPLACLPRAAAPPLACLPRAAAPPLACLPGAAEGEKGHKTYPLPVVKRSREITKAGIFPELPPFDTQYWKRSEERRLAAMKELKEKQAILEQRRKDQELLREWRTHAKIMQERKILEHKQARLERQRKEETLKTLVSGSDTKLRLTRSEAATGLASNRNMYLQCAESVVLHSDGPIEAPPQLVSQKAPYATDSLVHDSVEVKPGNTQQRLQNQRSQKEAEETRVTRDRELEHRIRIHVQMMQERRRRPRGTVEEETAAARLDMEEAKKLQEELDARKQEKDLEYRFIAYTGESSPR
ncbi:leucine-rich repeat-containing protein 27-like [Osmerus eperlanus]|uniref:leucine-rich repeat-containing protein 27-like n=1 Tax=Osmerus eperlanus TaxID=29151 RepID=UPI002E106A03